MHKHIVENTTEAYVIVDYLREHYDVHADVSSHNLIVSWLEDFELTPEDLGAIASETHRKTELYEAIGREYFSIEDTCGEKWIHFHGYTYDHDGADKPFRSVEYTWLRAPLKEVLEHEDGISGWYEEFSELSTQYIYEYDEAEFADLVDSYYGISVFGPGENSMSPGEPLSWADINMNTPCGSYYDNGIEPEKAFNGQALSQDADLGERYEYFAVINPDETKQDAVFFIAVSRNRLFEPDPEYHLTYLQNERVKAGDVWNVANYFKTDHILGYMGFENKAFGFAEVKAMINSAAPYGVTSIGPHDNLHEALNAFEAQKNMYASVDDALAEQQFDTVEINREDVER